MAEPGLYQGRQTAAAVVCLCGCSLYADGFLRQRADAFWRWFCLRGQACIVTDGYRLCRYYGKQADRKTRWKENAKNLFEWRAAGTFAYLFSSAGLTGFMFFPRTLPAAQQGAGMRQVWIPDSFSKWFSCQTPGHLSAEQKPCRCPGRCWPVCRKRWRIPVLRTRELQRYRTDCMTSLTRFRSINWAPISQSIWNKTWIINYSCKNCRNGMCFPNSVIKKTRTPPVMWRRFCRQRKNRKSEWRIWYYIQGTADWFVCTSGNRANPFSQYFHKRADKKQEKRLCKKKISKLS